MSGVDKQATSLHARRRDEALSQSRRAKGRAPTMNHTLPPLTMAASIEVDGTEVWYQMSSSECDARGLRSYVRDEDAEGAIVVLPLNEVSDAPRCEHCGKATPDLETCEDDGDTEQRCADCLPDEDDGDHYDAPDSRDGEVDDGPMTTGCYMQRLGRAAYR